MLSSVVVYCHDPRVGGGGTLRYHTGHHRERVTLHHHEAEKDQDLEFKMQIPLPARCFLTIVRTIC